MENISLRQNLKECWNLLKTNYKVLFLATVIMGAVSMITDSIDNELINLLSQIVTLILQMGFIKITLDILDAKKPELKTLFNERSRFFQYLLLVVLSVIIIVGPILIVAGVLIFGFFKGAQGFDASLWGIPVDLPGPVIALLVVISLVTFFFVIPRMMFANVAIIDNKEKAWQSIKTSFLITKERKIQTILLFLLIICMNIIGVMLFLIGLLVTIPLSQLMISKYYRQISGKLMPVVEEIPAEIVEVENTPA